MGLRVWVNSSFHQYAIDFSTDAEEARNLQRHMLRKWSLPYDVYRSHNGGRSPRRVLVLGAGTGNDVVVALYNGADEVVAVEIDPVILELGRRLNPSRPYDDPRVTAIVGDARTFLRTCTSRFDLVVFGTLDSQALPSGHSSVRLESFVYTREAVADAEALLAERGVLAVYYAVFKPWLYQRIFSTVQAVFGEHLRLFRFDDSQFLFNTAIVAGDGVGATPEDLARYGGGLPSSDDWPFIYLAEPVVGLQYLSLLAMVAVLIVGALLLLRREHRVAGLYSEYLFLGLGFTLMESSAVVRMALLFGSTWTVHAVVFAAVLAMVFVANWVVLRGLAPPHWLTWSGLFAFLLVNFLFPMESLFAVALPLRVLGAGVLVGVPVFFAATCFSTLFRREPTTGYPLGINLIGAMGGGLVEYASMAIGMRRIWLIAMGVYGCAWLSATVLRRRRW